MTRLTAIVVMPPDEQHAHSWRRLIEIHPSATREARRAKAPPPIPALADLRGVPRVDRTVAPPPLPDKPSWWAVQMEELRARRAKRPPSAADRRRANRRARKAIKRRAYLNRTNAARGVHDFMVAS